MNYSATEPQAAGPGDDEPFIEEVIFLLPRIGQRLHAATAEHAQVWGLTVGQAKVLLKVGLCGALPVGEIAGALGVSMPAASEIVDRLVDVGFVRRDGDPGDRRRVLVAPSDAAKRFAVGLTSERRRQVRGALAALTPAERPVLVRGLEALLDAFGDAERSVCDDRPAASAGPDRAPIAADPSTAPTLTIGSDLP